MISLHEKWKEGNGKGQSLLWGFITLIIYISQLNQVNEFNGTMIR